MRRAPAEVRTIEADPIYQSLLVAQIINKVLLKGKKGAARRIVYGALDIVERRTGAEPIQTLKRAVENIRPSLEVRSRRVGGSSYQVPVEVRPRRQQTLGVRWLVEFARRRKEPTMAERLANEILDAANRTGSAVKRREDVRLAVFDVSGSLVRTLVTGEKDQGRHEAAWDGRNHSGGEVPSGVYFYLLETRDTRLTGKITFVK